MISRWKFYLYGMLAVLGSMAYGVFLTHMLPFWAVLPVCLISGFVIGSAAAHELLRRLLPPSE